MLGDNTSISFKDKVLFNSYRLKFTQTPSLLFGIALLHKLHLNHKVLLASNTILV